MCTIEFLWLPVLLLNSRGNKRSRPEDECYFRQWNTVFKGLCRKFGLTGMCFSLFLSPHSQPICPDLNHTHMQHCCPWVKKEIQAEPRHTGLIKAAPKKNKRLINTSEERLQGISEITARGLLRKTLNRIYLHEVIIFEPSLSLGWDSRVC